MVLYNERRELKFYEERDISKISSLVGEIRYIEGFLEAVRWEDNPRKSNFELAKKYAREVLNLIKKYNEMPRRTKNVLEMRNTISSLEVCANAFLDRKKHN